MNTPARLFRDLLSTWQRDASSERVDCLAAELAAQAARTPSSLCLGIMESDSIKSLFGLIYLLDGYGLILRQRYREQRDGVFIFLDRKREPVSEFTGGLVHELEDMSPLPEFAKAA